VELKFHALIRDKAKNEDIVIIDVKAARMLQVTN
jgi:hypothetical protein